jgi:hypothetical protein
MRGSFNNGRVTFQLEGDIGSGRGYAPPMSAENESPKHDDIHSSRLGQFIQNYSTFLSTFVIGVAGLVATSIWQYRQSQTALKQVESKQKIATAKAENEWRIARAEILAQNLNVLSPQGANTADQRFGVLLSLTRGAILDPELALVAWKSMLAALQKTGDHYAHAFARHRLSVKRERAIPLPMVKKASLCGIAETAAEVENP